MLQISGRDHTDALAKLRKITGGLQISVSAEVTATTVPRLDVLKEDSRHTRGILTQR